jgi:hypothetical protein
MMPRSGVGPNPAGHLPGGSDPARPPGPLKPDAADAEDAAMRCRSLHFEAGGDELTLHLHPRLTVVGGLVPEARPVLVADLVAALLRPRPGTRASLEDDDGRPVAPLAERIHPVPEPADVAALVRVGDLAAGHAPERASVLDRLAAVPAEDLDRLVTDLSAATARLERLREACGSAVGEVAELDAVDERHRLLEEERTGAARRCRVGLGAATALAVAAVLAAVTAGPVVGAVALAGSAAAAVASLRIRRRTTAIDAEERRALADAGAETMLGLQLRRVNVLLATTRQRRDLAAAATEVEALRAGWDALARPLPPEVLDSLTGELALLRTLRSCEDAHPSGTGGSLLALMDRIASTRFGGAAGPRLPLVLDGTLDPIDPRVATCFLEMVLDRADAGQIVVLTGSTPLLEWAKGRSSGRLGVVTPEGAVA